MALNQWIPIDQRAPTQEDADEYKTVLWWHTLNGCMVSGINAHEHNRFMTHWMPLPEGPEGYAETRRMVSGKKPLQIGQ